MLISIICIAITVYLIYDVYRYWMRCSVLERIILCKFNQRATDKATAFILENQLENIVQLEPEEFTRMYGEYMLILDSLEDNRIKYIFRDYGLQMKRAYETHQRNML